MNTSLCQFKPFQRQQGAVLIISLMLLIILTMLGISALDSTKLETKMAANTAERNRALQTAEIGLKIPITYTVNKVEKLVDIAMRADGNPMPPEYYCFDSSNPVVPKTTDVCADSVSNALEIQTIRSKDFYPDKSGKAKCAGDCILNFIIKSTSRSRKDVNAPRVMLRGGMSRIIPTSNGNNGGGGCSSEDRSSGDISSTDCYL